MSDPNNLPTQDRMTQDTAANALLSTDTDAASQASSASESQDAGAAALAPKTQDDGNILPISFQGTAKQYFKIFIVNLLLTIITLGIYSAWARVRTRRFFLGHTYIDKHNLEFDARPITILISRILVVIVVGGLFFVEYRFDLIRSGVGIFLVGVLLLMPFALVRGRAFIARHTIHRTVRFRYRLEYKRPVILYLGYAFFAILITYTATLLVESEGMTYLAAYIAAALAFPMLLCLGHRIQINQLQFGRLRFFHEGGVGRYYREAIKALFLSIGIFIIVNIVLFSLIYIYTYIATVVVPPVMSPSGWIGGAAILGIIIGLLFATAFIAPIRAAFTCLYWRSFRIDKDSAIESHLKWIPYARLLAVNHVLIISSLGLMYPWARVRAYRHVAERLQVRLGPETAAEYLSSPETFTPIAGEFADVTGWDFDFGAI
ncbi:MAG: DUF898 domain-containing protein [Ectothiorhodospiraceae bacterium AqS1]|nr:DUF898 domain-containing protein [Ectothiorhodospiraceae bacterium AqS1]